MRSRASFLIAIIVILVASFAPSAAQAQPFGGWLILDSSNAGHIAIPHDPALNPTEEFTYEAWVFVPPETGCFSLAGKRWTEAWWIGTCGGTLRSYLRGQSSNRDGGELRTEWTHIAVTFDGTYRRHYINGEMAGEWLEPGPLTTSTAEMRIGSDVAWNPVPNGALDETRLWNVGRTTAEIRANLNQKIRTPTAGLVGVWAMNGAQDELGDHDGTLVGHTPSLTFPVTFGCTTTDTSLCLFDRFAVSVDFRRPSGVEGSGTVVECIAERSGLFWFFNEANWELLVKMVDGCGNNNRWWVFSAATTNVFYRLEVLDVVKGAQRIYFNYPGPPAPAVTDTQAFDTCP